MIKLNRLEDLKDQFATYKCAFEAWWNSVPLRSSSDTYKHAFETTAADRDIWKNKYQWFRWNLATRPVSSLDIRDIASYPKEMIQCYQFISEIDKGINRNPIYPNFVNCHAEIELNGILIGAEKSGTSYLYACIREQNGIFVGDKDRDFRKILTSPSAVFEELFLFGRKPSQPVMAFDAAFMLGENFATILANKTQGKLKIVAAVLRDPIERALSEYRMRLRQGFEYLPFIEAIKASSARLSTSPGNWDYWWAYLERSLYWKQLEPYTKIFGKEVLMVRLFEQSISENPQNLVAEILSRFNLGIPVTEQYQNLIQLGGKEVVSSKCAPTSTQARFGVTQENLKEWLAYFPQGDELEELIDFFRSDIVHLRDHFGLDVARYWKTSAVGLDGL